MAFKEVVEEFTEEPLTRQIVLHLLRGYKRPNDKAVPGGKSYVGTEQLRPRNKLKTINPS